MRVQDRCHLADLPGLFEREVVTLVAHWRSWRVLPRDLRDVPGLARRLTDPHDPASARVREQLPPDVMDRVRADHPTEGRPDDPLAVAIAGAFNAVIDGGWLGPGAPTAPAPADRAQSGQDLLRRTHNRSLLDRAFDGLLTPGNRIELAGGMHPVDDIIRAIPASFTGFIDLTVCNSVLLGEAIKRERPGCLVVMNLNPTNFDLRIVVYRHLIRYLSRFRKNYLDAVSDLRIGVLHPGSKHP